MNNQNQSLDFGALSQPSYVKSKQTGPPMITPDPNLMPVMNNKRLEKFSSKYITDTRDQVEQRCFFLFAGSDLN